MELQLVFFNLVYFRELLQMLLGVVLFFGGCMAFFATLSVFWYAIKAFIF